MKDNAIKIKRANKALLKGASSLKAGRYQEAERLFRQVIATGLQMAEAYRGLGMVLRKTGRIEEALQSYQQAVGLAPSDMEALIGMALSLADIGQLPEAVQVAQQATLAGPQNGAAHLTLGLVARSAGDLIRAESSLERAMQIQSADSETLAAYGSILLLLGKVDQAKQCAQKALIADRAQPEAISLHANLLERTGEYELAWEFIQPKLKERPLIIDLLNVYGKLARYLGRQQKAVKLIGSLLKQDRTLSPLAQRHLNFTLGAIYDSIKQYNPAFEHFQRGNQLRGAGIDRQSLNTDCQALISFFSPERLRQLPRASNQSELPVFIVGMPRSGTSLVDQILSQHSRVFATGESTAMSNLVNYLQSTSGLGGRYPGWLEHIRAEHIENGAENYLRYLESLAAGAARVIDKTPNNYIYLGLLQQLFPAARVIHCQRDPRDICLSAYFQDFAQGHEYTFDLKHLGAVYSAYSRIMTHLKKVIALPILNVQYETLVSNPDEQIRIIVDFCGLNWESACLNFHESDRFVATASYEQVRQPVYTGSVARWRHYAEHIKPLLDELQAGKVKLD